MTFLTYIASFGVLFEVGLIETISSPQNYRQDSIPIQQINSQQIDSQISYGFAENASCSIGYHIGDHDNDARELPDRVESWTELVHQPLETQQVSHRGSGRNCSDLGC